MDEPVFPFPAADCVLATSVSTGHSSEPRNIQKAGKNCFAWPWAVCLGEAT